MKLDGSNPTLVDAYGGFEISMLPGCVLFTLKGV